MYVCVIGGRAGSWCKAGEVPTETRPRLGHGGGQRGAGEEHGPCRAESLVTCLRQGALGPQAWGVGRGARR